MSSLGAFKAEAHHIDPTKLQILEINFFAIPKSLKLELISRRELRLRIELRQTVTAETHFKKNLRVAAVTIARNFWC